MEYKNTMQYEHPTSLDRTPILPPPADSIITYKRVTFGIRHKDAFRGHAAVFHVRWSRILSFVT